MSEIWVVSGPENVLWIGKSVTEKTAGKVSVIWTNEANVLSRFERGGLPVSEQRLEPRAITDTHRGLR